MSKFRDLLEKNWRGEIVRAIPKRAQVEPDQLIQACALYTYEHPELLEEDVNQTSLFVAILNAARMGLDPSLDQGWLIARKQKGKRDKLVTFTPSIDGLIHIASRSSKFLGLRAHTVFEGDEFEHDLGTTPYIAHRKNVSGSGSLVARAWYAIVYLRDSEPRPFVMSREEVDRLRSAGFSDSPAWTHWYDRMGETKCGKAALSRIDLGDAQREMRLAINAVDIHDAEAIEMDSETKTIRMSQPPKRAIEIQEALSPKAAEITARAREAVQENLAEAKRGPARTEPKGFDREESPL